MPEVIPPAVSPAPVKPSLYNTAVGHALVSAGVTAVVTLLSALASDASFANAVLGGGTTVTIIKFVVDLLNHNIPNL